jgi:hypothetical protein
MSTFLVRSRLKCTSQLTLEHIGLFGILFCLSDRTFFKYLNIWRRACPLPPGTRTTLSDQAVAAMRVFHISMGWRFCLLCLLICLVQSAPSNVRSNEGLSTPSATSTSSDNGTVTPPADSAAPPPADIENVTPSTVQNIEYSTPNLYNLAKSPIARSTREHVLGLRQVRNASSLCSTLQAILISIKDC